MSDRVDFSPAIYSFILRSSLLASAIASGSNSSALLFNLINTPQAASSMPAATQMGMVEAMRGWGFVTNPLMRLFTDVETLIDPERRHLYDRGLHAGAPAAPGEP